MTAIPTAAPSHTASATLIRRLGLMPRAQAEIQDLYSRSIAA